MSRRLLAVFVAALASMAVAALPTAAQAGHVVPVPTGDPEMVAAIAKARASLPQFWKSLDKPGEGEEGFALKVAIKDGDKVEHFWLVNPAREGDKYSGTINNDPQTVRSVQDGQRYEFAEADISDWMFMRNGKIVGNETLRPLLKRMPPATAEQYRAMLESP